MTLLEAARAFCSQYGIEKTYWIAYSGGLDSHVLLKLFVMLRAELSLRLQVVHINHNLSPHAQKWAQHCAQTCREFAVDYTEHTVRLDVNTGDSLEEIAREERYAKLALNMQQGDVLLTAHHQDDQAETMLLQLLRGAGPQGLAAMPALKSFGVGFHGRPLLNFSRALLQQFAIEHDLRWIDDESNQNARMTRNFIRHDVLPILKKRWPTVTATLARSASHCAETHTLLVEFAQQAYQDVKGTAENTLSVSKLSRLDVAKQKLVLRTWIQAQQYLLPPTTKIEAILRDVLTAEEDRIPMVSWNGVELRRYQDNLHLMPPLNLHDTQQVIQWNMSDLLHIKDIGYLTLHPVLGDGLQQTISDISVRFRQGGEVLRTFGGCRRPLKKLLQEWQVLPWLRDRLPLIYSGEKLIAVPGYAVDPDYAVKKDELGWKISFAVPRI